jgi:hypothetical protein
MATVPTSPVNVQRIDAVYKANERLICSLANRWADEHEYEDISAYQEAIQEKLPEGFTIVKMTRRPFGFHFSIGTGAVYFMKAAARQYSWGRIS